MARNPIRLAGAVALALAALAAAYLAFQIAISAAFATAPQLVLRVAPSDPRALFRLASERYLTAKRLRPEDYAAVRGAADRVPLSAEPFVLAATGALARKDGAAAERLLLEAQRRNPRQRLARTLLLERYLRTGRYAQAGQELAALNRLIPRASTLLVDGMSAMAMDPTATAAVAQAMKGDPGLNSLLATMIKKGAPTDRVLLVARGLSAVPDAGNPPIWRTMLLDRLVTQGRYREARALWAQFTQASPATMAAPVQNMSFERREGLAPFSWRTATDETGAAEFTRRGSATIDYFGRRTGELMGQLITLTPGRYQLSFQAEGNATGRGSKLGWFVRCAVPGKPVPTGPVLLEAAIVGITHEPRKLGKAFVVPASGCPAQWLTLEGHAAEFPTNQSIELSRFAITRAGAGK